MVPRPDAIMSSGTVAVTWLSAEIASADGERRLPPRGCGLYLDAIDPLDPPVAPPPGGHKAHREPVIGGEGNTAHLRGEQQTIQVVDRETDPVAGNRVHVHALRSRSAVEQRAQRHAGPVLVRIPAGRAVQRGPHPGVERGE